MPPWAVTLVAFGFAAIVALVVHRGAKARDENSDAGTFWARVVLWLAVLPPLIVVSAAGEVLWPRFYQGGWHLLIDLTATGPFALSPAWRFFIALALPFVFFLALLLIFLLAVGPGEREEGRWIAGAVGFGNRRAWILLCALPLVPVLAFTVPRLGGGGGGAYPGAAWGTMAVFLLALFGIAWSAGQPAATATGGPPAPPGAARLRPWPQAMAARGIDLETITAWPPSTAARAVGGGPAKDLADRLRLLGVQHVAPEMVEAVAALLDPRRSAGKDALARLVFAPDDCGQHECTALAASLLDQRFHATTLVVTARGAGELARQLQRWLPSQSQAAAIGRSGEPRSDALIWVVDAEILSDRLLPMLHDPQLVKRIGLVVWWHLEDYTGVLGANLWAISRRLHRLIHLRGRHDVRTLALVRSATYGGAQLGTFVRRLLPHPFPPAAETHVEQRFPRAVHLHRLVSHQGYFTHSANRSIPARSRHLPLIAGRASVEEGWSTHLEVPEDVSGSEARTVLGLPAAGAVLGEQLRPDGFSAGAWVRRVGAGEILSLVEIVSQGGRAAEEGLPHHIALSLPANPYVKYLLSTLAAAGESSQAFRTSRRLVCAEAHPSIIRRHLLLALNEVPDTRRGLLKNFLWQEEIIRQALDEISHEGKLTRREVRFLDGRDQLAIDHQYESRRLPGGELRPLDTVSANLIDVREEAVGFEAEGVRMRVDPERLTIQAYPNRVFMHRGRRFRIREWTSPEEVCDRGWLACEREDVYSLTWRIRSPFVYGFEALGDPVGIGRRGQLLTRMAVDLHYEEEISGTIRVIPDLTSGSWGRPENIRPSQPITQSFDTRALVLRFPQPEDFIALASVCQALRHVLPVHLGAEEDALEVVPLAGEDIDGLETYGLAIVDLYPSGIGMIDAIRDDNTLILQLLEWTRTWLAACPCQNNDGCPECLRSAAAKAANPTQRSQRAAALKLLQQII